jgi:NodT family efflux transporter outer membrane factor (OMF) lipoprotein
MRRTLSTFFDAGCVLGFVLALGGCNVGPDFKRPDVPVAQDWRTKDPRVASQTAADAVWWKTFNDATLDHLVDLAYRQNLPLQVAGLRIVEARARWGIATGKQFPQVQEIFGSAAAIGLSNNATNNSGLDGRFFDYRVGFDAAWEMDFWGKYRRGVEAEAANLLASVGDYYYSLVSLTAEVARTYVAIRTAEVLIEQAQQNVKLQEEALSIAESRFRNGETSELDPSQATTLLESTRASIPERQVALQQARNALSTLLGQPSGFVDTLLSGPKTIPIAPAKVAIGVPAEVLRRRPDIRSAELLAAAQCARIGVAKADLYPSFSLVGTIGLQAGNAGGTWHPFFSSDSIFYGLGPQFKWPILNYGRIKNAVRLEDARFQQLLVKYRDTVLNAQREVEDALAGFLNAQEAVTFLQNAVAAAQRAASLALTQYREGATDYQRVVDAERSLLTQQNTLAQSSSSVATSLVALYKALGGGWELREGQPYVPEQMQQQMKDRTDWGEMLSKPRSPEIEQKHERPKTPHEAASEPARRTSTGRR